MSLMYCLSDGAEEVFYVLSDEKAKNVQFLQECKQALMSTEPLNPKLDRNIQVQVNVQHCDS